MIYSDFKNLKLSALGLGTMRLPTFDGDDSKINKEKTREIVDKAISSGINYFDTAFGYHSGNSELVIGELLSQYPRDSFYLASKFPGFSVENMEKVEEIFERQLKKCRVDYFDFYLFHNLCEANVDGYLDEKYGIFNYLMKQKRLGRIKHLGFSTHGSYETVSRFLKAYGKDMEFAQIQLNYFDYDFQDAKSKLELLAQYNIPVWVMEPVRGGKLAALDSDSETKLKQLRPDESVAAWAFRYLQGFNSVKMILSGMSNLEQLEDNIKTFSELKPLNGKESEVIREIANKMITETALACTGCKYCISKCPKSLDIPALISLYNEHKSTEEGGGFIAPMALSTYDEDKLPSACIGCRSCESVCPQGIKISKALKDFSLRLNEN